MKSLFIGMMAMSLLLISQPVPAGGDGCNRCGRMPHLSPSLRGVMKKAHKLMASDNMKAGRMLAEYAEKHPNAAHCKFSFLRGVIAFQGNDPAQAECHFAKAVELWPCYVPALINHASVTYQLGDPVQAARLMQKAYENCPKARPQYLYQAAAFYLAARQPVRALPLLSQLARMPQAKPLWLKALVQAYLELKRYEEAEAALMRLLNKTPGDADLWSLSARLNLDQQDYAKAAADLEISFRLSAPPVRKWKTLADLYRMAGVPLKAVLYYRRAFDGKPGPKELDFLAGVYFEANRLDEAVKIAYASIKQKPSAKRWRLVAQIHTQHKNYTAALKAYEEAARLAPKNARLKLMAGYCAMQMEDYKQALDHLALAVARAKPGSKEAREAKSAMESIRKYLSAADNGKSHDLVPG